MKLLPLVAAGLLAGAATVSHALDIKPFSTAALADAQNAGKPVALFFHADWCPTCRAQEKALEALKSDPTLQMTVLVANYDTETALKRQYKVRSQSTIVVLRGREEWARVVGDTAPARIGDALKSAL